MNQQRQFIPEILSPAGDLERLKVAFQYGADAVYLGGTNYLGLRAAAKNFSDHDLQEGLDYAHERNKKVYVTVNSFLHDEDFVGARNYLEKLSLWGVDACIVSDLGVVKLIRDEFPQLEVHLSTQASCVNAYAAQFWKSFGVTRMVVGRELTVVEAGAIGLKADCEIEMFVHGSLCMSYSGHCTISNYTSGRDSNRGGCAHSCRHEYSLSGEKHESQSYFMSSKDLYGIHSIPTFFKQKIHSLKIEGRMKGPMYVGTTAKVYRELVDEYAQQGFIDEKLMREKAAELELLMNRGYTSANFVKKADQDSIAFDKITSSEDHNMMAYVLEVDRKEGIILDVRASFQLGENLTFIQSKGKNLDFKICELKSLSGEDIQSTKPNTLVRIPFMSGVEARQVVVRI